MSSFDLEPKISEILIQKPLHQSLKRSLKSYGTRRQHKKPPPLLTSFPLGPPPRSPAPPKNRAQIPTRTLSRTLVQQKQAQLSYTSTKHEKNTIALSSVKTDSSALTDWKNKREHTKENFLRPTLSKIYSTSLEFSEALPFTAFASLLVEMVAKLDNVIEEVGELGRIGCFKEFQTGDENDDYHHHRINVRDENAIRLQIHLPSHGAD